MSVNIGFNVPPYSGKELDYIRQAIEAKHISGDGEFTRKCNDWFLDRTGAKWLLTTSGSHALDMAGILTNVQPGDEVIVPSFTFVTTVSAFVLRGAVPVFVDIRPDTMNIDEKLIEDAITEKTKVIVPVHYAGVACEMDEIMRIAKKHNLLVVEDAAQAVMSEYKGKPLGTIGDFGCYSFHETKNYSMGEGGAIICKRPEDFERAEIVREKGTNRSRFFRGQVDKYTWVEVGSSYLPSDMNAAYLYAQLEVADEILEHRLHAWDLYYENLKDVEELEMPYIPEGCKHNAHMFYVKTKDLATRTELMDYLKGEGISTVFHYVPLHSSPAGEKYGRFHGEDKYTTSESERLVRLPMYNSLSDDDVKYVCEKIREFFK